MRQPRPWVTVRETRPAAWKCGSRFLGEGSITDTQLAMPHPLPLTMVDDTVLQQGLAQVDPFFRLADLTNFQEPGDKLTARNKDAMRWFPALEPEPSWPGPDYHSNGRASSQSPRN